MSQVFGRPPYCIERDELLHRELQDLTHPKTEPEPSPAPEYDRRTQKRCIKCRTWKDRQGPNKGFGDHPTSSDGLQSICYTCKNKANNRAREKNVTARLRHHIGTRCLTQLGAAAPEGFTRDLEKYLGYKIRRLVRHLGADLKEREGPKRKLRDALQEGYHVDHIRPLSLYRVVVGEGPEATVDWEQFRECWKMDNLRAIPAAENLAKGAKYDDPPF